MLCTLFVLTYEDNVKPNKKMFVMQNKCLLITTLPFHGSPVLAGPVLVCGGLCHGTLDPASFHFQKVVKEFPEHPLCHWNLQPQAFSQGPFTQQRFPVKTQNCWLSFGLVAWSN